MSTQNSTPAPVDRCPKCGGRNGYEYTMIEAHVMSGHWGEDPEAVDEYLIRNGRLECVDCGEKFNYSRARRIGLVSWMDVLQH